MVKSLLVFLLLLTGLAVAEPPAGLWLEEERHGGLVRGKWTYLPAARVFRAIWSNGSEAELRLEQYDDNHIVITRADTNGPCAGLRARYEGTRSDRGYSGQVTWTWLDQARRGTWSVTLPPEKAP